MSTSIEQQSKGKKDGEIRYLTPLNIDTNKTKKYCRFKKSGIKYIDYKDPDFLLKFVNEQGKILPRRLTGTSLKYQRKVSVAVKRARHLALIDDANKIAEALKALEVRISAKVGTGDKLFGSVSNIDIAEALEKEGQSIDKKFITVTTVKRLGKYTAVVRLHREVSVDLEFEVIAQAN